jgi:hypothetical protein
LTFAASKRRQKSEKRHKTTICKLNMTQQCGC